MDNTNKKQRLKLKQHIQNLKRNLWTQYVIIGLIVLFAMLCLFRSLWFSAVFWLAIAGLVGFIAYKIKQSISQYDYLLYALREDIELDVEEDEILTELMEQKSSKNQSSKKVLIGLGIFFFFILFIVPLDARNDTQTIKQATSAPKPTENPPTNNTAKKTEPKQPENKSVQSKPIQNNKGWQPEKACHFLENTDYFSTRNHMKYQDSFGNNEYMCASPEFALPSNSFGVPNDLSYRVLGTKNTVHTLKLVLDLHQPYDASAGDGVALLISNANKLSIAATGNQLPEGIPQGLLVGKNTTVNANGFKHTVINKPFANGRGYEIHYVLTKK